MPGSFDHLHPLGKMPTSSAPGDAGSAGSPNGPMAAFDHKHARESAKWTAYTPGWHAVSGDPTLGNGTLTGAYFKFGLLTFIHIALICGSTTSGGLGQMFISLPVGAQSGFGEQELSCKIASNSIGFTWVGAAVIFDGGVSAYPLFPVTVSSSQVGGLQNADASGNVANAIPGDGTHAPLTVAGSNLEIWGFYEAAA